MRTPILPAGAGDELDAATRARAVDLLREGGVVAAPTDTLYGLCALAFERRGVESVREAKGLAEDDPLLLIVPDASWARELASEISPAANDMMERLWPGPLTFLLAAGERVPTWVRGEQPAVAVRWPLPCAALALARAVA